MRKGGAVESGVVAVVAVNAVEAVEALASIVLGVDVGVVVIDVDFLVVIAVEEALEGAIRLLAFSQEKLAFDDDAVESALPSPQIRHVVLVHFRGE